jgi:alpha-mannosidase
VNRFFTGLAVLSFPVLIFSMPGVAQSATLWEIGKFDQSNHEFKAAPSGHVVYQFGKSDWAQEWPGQEQTGAAYEIRFNLDAAPRGAFALKISLLTGYFGIPDMQVEINGHVGLFYVRSKPFYVGNNAAWDVMTIELPTRYMVRGENSLVLSPVGTQPASVGNTAPAESVRYDFIGLTNDSHAVSSHNDVVAEVVPTVFYRRKEGKLVEIVDAYLRFGQAIPSGRATLTLNQNNYSAEIPAGGDFGEKRIEFEVPEWQGAAAAKLQVNAGSQNSFNSSVTAERKWTLFVVPHTHVDIGYTDYQGKVAENQADTLLEAADLIKKYPEFRFATDGSWNLQQLMETRPESERNEILGLIRTDKIGLPAEYFNLLTGYASLETLYRSFYYTKGLSREYHLPFNYATTTDVPSYTGAYPSVLASAGIKYWAVGANQDRAPVLMHEQWNEKSPFWWQGPDGNKVLFWYSWSYSQIGVFFSLDPTNARIHESLPEVLAPYDRTEYKPDAILVYGAQNENTDLHPQLASFASAWNQAYEYPKLRYSTFADFFDYIDEHFGAALPTYKGDMGPYWEDGIGSDAYYAAEDRQNQSDALSAEIVSTTAHVMNLGFHLPKAEIEDAWNNILLFAEHTWGAGNSISQPDSREAVKQLAAKDNYATQAHFELEDITNRSLYQLARQIQVPSGTFVVFNGLSWKRDALIEADLRRNQGLVDLTTHQDVPFEVVSDKENVLHVRFLARDLPSVGYKCFQTRNTPNSVQTALAPDKSPVIENSFYRVTIDAASGAVQSIFDKQLQREIVDTRSPYRFGQYLYVSGGDPKGDGQTQMIHAYRALPTAELTIHPATSGEYLGAQKTPWGYSIKLRSSAVNTPAVGLEILLYDNEKKIEFHYNVEKTYTTAKEGVYFAFPTAVDRPEFAYGTQQGWVDPSRDLLKGASLEWFSIQKWMAVHDSGLTVGIVPLDASLASFGDINRGEWPETFQPKTSTIFSYAMNNYWHTNYRAGQGGTFTFRYVMTSAAHFDPAALSRVGWESMETPALDSVANQDKVGNPDEPLPAEGASFLDVSAPNIVLVTWKLAEDGEGTILRLQETAGQSVEATVRFPHASIRSANLCTSVEDNLQSVPVTGNEIHLSFHPHQVLTVRLTVDSQGRRDQE